MAESWEAKKAEFEARQQEMRSVLDTQKICIALAKDLYNIVPERQPLIKILIDGYAKGIKYLEGEE